MGRAEVDKVVAYIVRDRRLVAFRHVGRSVEEVGIQVPAGTIEAGESSATAAVREAEEETGLAGLRVVRFLGEARYDLTPYRPEVQRRFFYELACDTWTPERWRSAEGEGPDRIEFECFWLDLHDAHVLQAGQGALIGRLFP